MTLHLMYRPSSWREVLGNRDSVDYLRSAVENPDRPHSYIFSGPSGCGKTTLARILSRELGCMSSDFVEVDSADYRGIDTIRDIRSQMMMAPMYGPCRVWLMDECHKLTSDAQSALLKALEDTPPHVYFLLATTDPQKLLPTIRNRCQSISVAPLDDDEMMRLLARVHKRTTSESINKGAADDIITASEGCPRQALQILEKYIANPSAPIETLTSDSKEIIDLCRALIKKQKWNSVKKLLSELKGTDPEKIRWAVMGYASAVLMKTEDAQALVLLDVFREPFYNSGWNGVVWACAVCVQEE